MVPLFTGFLTSQVVIAGCFSINNSWGDSTSGNNLGHPWAPSGRLRVPNKQQLAMMPQDSMFFFWGQPWQTANISMKSDLFPKTKKRWWHLEKMYFAVNFLIIFWQKLPEKLNKHLRIMMKLCHAEGFFAWKSEQKHMSSAILVLAPPRASKGFV